jgi:sulfatase maturation enzyme AslB (radical SAM superfamily)
MEHTNCKWIQHGIEFGPNNIKTCCYGGNIGGGRPIIIDNYNGEKIDWEKMFVLKREMRNIQKSGEIVEKCVGCEFLQKREWDDDDYIDQLIFNHWTHCNCKCSYCFTEGNKEQYNTHKPYKVLPILKEMIDKKILRAGGYVNFGGGEPTILEEFEDLVNMLLNHNVRLIDVFSSGIKYSPIIKKGLDLGKISLTVSVDAGSAEVYKKIKQVPCFDTVWQNLEKYAELKNNFIRTKYIIIPGVNDTEQEIESWLQLNKKVGISNLLFDIETNWFLDNRKNIPSGIIDLIEFFEKSSQELNINGANCLNVIMAKKMHNL